MMQRKALPFATSGSAKRMALAASAVIPEEAGPAERSVPSRLQRYMRRVYTNTGMVDYCRKLAIGNFANRVLFRDVDR
jgi:ABC-type sulfate transport system substrate-binding protein